MAQNEINLDYLSSLSGGDTEFMADIIQTYLEESPKDLETFQTALANKNVEATGKAAHKMKSSFQMLGLGALHQKALQIEQSAKQGHQELSDYIAWGKELVEGTTESYTSAQTKLNELNS